VDADAFFILSAADEGLLPLLFAAVALFSVVNFVVEL